MMGKKKKVVLKKSAATFDVEEENDVNEGKALVNHQLITEAQRAQTQKKVAVMRRRRLRRFLKKTHLCLTTMTYTTQ